MASYGSPATTLLQMSKQQWEVDAKERFVRFLEEQYRQAYLATAENVFTNPAIRRDFDYELTAHIAGLPVIALEIFRIVGDERDLGHHRAWNDVVQRLTKELKDKDVSGYLIRTPHFNVPKSRRNQFASETAELLAAANAKHPDEEQFAVDGYTVYKLQGGGEVRFSCIGGVRAINPFGSVSDALDNLLPTKNDQLNTQGRLRALLILNAGIFPHEEHDICQYFSTRDLEEFPNIDKVFFEESPGILP